MKKIVLCLLAVLCVFSIAILAGCGGDEGVELAVVTDVGQYL